MSRHNQCGIRPPAARRGVSTAEFAFVFPVFIVLVLGFLDVGVMLVRHRLLADAAERVAREAAIRGGLSQPAGERWGPAAWSTDGSDSEINGVIAPSLTTMNAGDIEVDVLWLDGNNHPGSRVEVTLVYQHDAVIPYLWNEDLLSLRTGSVVRISH